MLEKMKMLLDSVSAAGRQSVSMQRKLMLYLLCLVLAAFVFLLMLLTFTGMLSSADGAVENGLQMQLHNAQSDIHKRMESLTAQGIALSQRLSRLVEDELVQSGQSISQLSNDAQTLTELQMAAFEPLYGALQIADCSGAYFFLDATVNTDASPDGSSRSGIYLRLANVAVSNPVDPAVMLYRGIPELARKNGLQLHNRWNLEFDMEYGTLYLSEFMESFVAVRDGATLFSHDGPDYVIMHPSGDWGISYFTGSEVEKIILNGTEMQTEPWAFPEVDMISSISISEDHIFVAGGAVENNEHTIFVYDLSGVLQTKLGGTEFGEDDSLGSVTAVVETANGYMALDGNMRTVLFWAPDGTFIGSAEDSDLFGTSYPWMSSASVMADGSILIGMTEERPDESADEFIVYRLTGF